jgi:Ca2+-dependent lipid-binding protein
MNDLNPNFAKSFVVDYIFETRQELRFEVYDEDDKKNDDLIGIVDVTLGALAGAKNQASILTLLNKGKDMGKLIVRCEKVE